MAEENCVHSEGLTRLCRVYGGLLNFSTECYKEELLEVFYCAFEKSQNAPSKFCTKCYSKLKVTPKRKSTIVFTETIWGPHTQENCATCFRYDVLKKGGKKKKFVRKGRPPNDGSREEWSKQDSLKLIKSTPIEEPHHLAPVELTTEANPQLQLCQCGLCHSVFRRPVKIKSCEDTFCLLCFTRFAEGKLKKNLRCPTCREVFEKDDVAASPAATKLLDSLSSKCEKGCGKTFKCVESIEKNVHESSCKGPEESFKLLDILNIPNTSEVPRKIEQAAYHVVRHKMVNSILPNNGIEFLSGGSRVSTSF